MSSTALPMRRHFWLVLFVLILAGQLRGKSLLVDASSHSMWVAISLPGEQGTPSQSAIFSRAMGSNQWQQLYQIASPIAELSHQGDEPAILLSNGQWMFVFQNGRSLGNDVPGGGNLAELGSDGTNIYAAAWVAGGIKAMQATSRPATAPATMASDQRLVLMRYQRGRW
ncbi:MAG TPA: hypothetical protein VG722_07495, partial [Tepidisphaeraceae bacterium]|nr:hypothetical protein [Tepidisphaeraceae bacterium]